MMKLRTSALLGSILVAMPLMTAVGYNAMAAQGTLHRQPATVTAHVAPMSWLRVNEHAKTAILRLTAGLTQDNHGMNFNGYSRGAMTVTVPLHWHVKVVFRNASASMPHSVEVVPYAQRTSTGSFTPAFPGAHTPDPQQGISGTTGQTFTFTANKAGTYAIVCGIPGHASFGMWDKVVVTKSARTPFVRVSTTTSSKSGSTDSTGTAGSAGSGGSSSSGGTSSGGW